MFSGRLETCSGAARRVAGAVRCTPTTADVTTVGDEGVGTPRHTDSPAVRNAVYSAVCLPRRLFCSSTRHPLSRRMSYRLLRRLIMTCPSVCLTV